MDLRPIAQEWHRRALSNIRTKPFSETWIEFLYAWTRVEYPLHIDYLANVKDRALKSQPLVLAQRYGMDSVGLLVQVCHELQCDWGDAPFVLSARAMQAGFSASAMRLPASFCWSLRRTRLSKLFKRAEEQQQSEKQHAFASSATLARTSFEQGERRWWADPKRWQRR